MGCDRGRFCNVAIACMGTFACAMACVYIYRTYNVPSTIYRYESGFPAETARETQSRLASQKAAAEKLDASRVQEAQLTADNIEVQAQKRTAADRLASQTAATEKLAASRVQEAQLTADNIEVQAQKRTAADRLASQKAAAKKLAESRAQETQLAADKVEAQKRTARLAQEADKLAAQKVEADKLAAQKVEAEKLAARLEAARLASEKAAENAKQVERDALKKKFEVASTCINPLNLDRNFPQQGSSRSLKKAYRNFSKMAHPDKCETHSDTKACNKTFICGKAQNDAIQSKLSNGQPIPEYFRTMKWTD